MARIYDKDGVAFLEGDMVDLKIDGSRKIYIKEKSKQTYTFIEHQCPENLTIVEKQQFLSKLNSMVEMKIRQYDEQQQNL